VRLPWYGALVTPSALGFEQGTYHHRGTRMYVNRGLGTLDLRVRLHCRPEVHEVRLISP
jgi:predicted MPP superfamily phosphohydrolase